MMQLRKSAERGHVQHGWLDAHHSFSFGDYHDPAHMGFGPLRVINEDRIAAGAGFPTHGHRDMEIITYVLEGELAHRDSIGNGSVIRPGAVQRMSAGRGVQHSESNPSAVNPIHLLQIWIQPNQQGIAPSYEEKQFAAAEKDGQLRVIASHDARDGSVTIHQDASLYAGTFDGAQTARLPLAQQRLAYVHLVSGSASVNGQPLQAGDALKLQDEAEVVIANGQQAEVLVFDLPH